ncbi:MAG: translation initiation factor IF-1 [Parcubacteria group bacterium]|nr:translation initiation factor IF-1 [Parcubacteria group bacterium]
MKAKNVPKAMGVITEALPNAFFRVALDASPGATPGGEGGEILAYLAGKMRMYRIKVLVGDRVELELDPYGGKGRITRRL